MIRIRVNLVPPEELTPGDYNHLYLSTNQPLLEAAVEQLKQLDGVTGATPDERGYMTRITFGRAFTEEEVIPSVVRTASRNFPQVPLLIILSVPNPTLELIEEIVKIRDEHNGNIDP